MCITPTHLKHPDNYWIQVPCGKCVPCKKRRTSGWSFRLMQEDRSSISSLFITLTYGKGEDQHKSIKKPCLCRDSHYPRRTKNGIPSLCKRDLQLFFKRLRKANNRRFRKMARRGQWTGEIPHIKYYAVGEYGGKRHRPHYHIILFNANIDAIEDAWKLGHVHYGDVSGASIGYTLKYIQKEKTNITLRQDDKLPEFSLMSKGLGKSYVTQNRITWHRQDLINRLYCTYEGGKKMAMPRYYKNLIYNIRERQLIKSYYERKNCISINTPQDDNTYLSNARMGIDKNGRLFTVDTGQLFTRDKAAYNNMHAEALKNQNLYETENFS